MSILIYHQRKELVPIQNSSSELLLKKETPGSYLNYSVDLVLSLAEKEIGKLKLPGCSFCLLQLRRLERGAVNQQAVGPDGLFSRDPRGLFAFYQASFTGQRKNWSTWFITCYHSHDHMQNMFHALVVAVKGKDMAFVCLLPSTQSSRKVLPQNQEDRRFEQFWSTIVLAHKVTEENEKIQWGWLAYAVNLLSSPKICCWLLSGNLRGRRIQQESLACKHHWNEEGLAHFSFIAQEKVFSQTTAPFL